MGKIYFYLLSPAMLCWVHIPAQAYLGLSDLDFLLTPNTNSDLTDFFHVFILPSSFVSVLHFPLWHVPVPKYQKQDCRHLPSAAPSKLHHPAAGDLQRDWEKHSL